MLNLIMVSKKRLFLDNDIVKLHSDKEGIEPPSLN